MVDLACCGRSWCGPYSYKNDVPRTHTVVYDGALRRSAPAVRGRGDDRLMCPACQSEREVTSAALRKDGRATAGPLTCVTCAPGLTSLI
jgi:hypothetical protein